MLGVEVAMRWKRALTIAALVHVGIFLERAEPPTDPPDNAPIRALGLIFVFGIPAAFLLSLLVAVPFTYLSWKRRPIRKSQVSILACAAAFAPVVPLAYVAMGLTFAPFANFLVACLYILVVSTLVFGIPAVAWWYVAPRALTMRWSGP